MKSKGCFGASAFKLMWSNKIFS